jgi:acetyltransferase-like isoleucine patch superfamily enzyme
MKNKTGRPLEKVGLSEQLHGKEATSYQRYCDKALGNRSWRTFLGYELATLLLTNLGGSGGYFLRKHFWSPLFRATGSGLILGRGIVIRHPGRMSLGNDVAIDDYVFLDASGSGELGLVMEDNVIISRNCIIQGKNGFVHLRNKCDIGANTVLSSVSGITIGEAVLIAGNCYVGGACYYHERVDISILDQGPYTRGPIEIGDGAWIGAGAVILDGVNIGKGSVVGAGAVVTKDIPDLVIAVGCPARIVGER